MCVVVAFGLQLLSDRPLVCSGSCIVFTVRSRYGNEVNTRSSVCMDQGLLS